MTPDLNHNLDSKGFHNHSLVEGPDASSDGLRLGITTFGRQGTTIGDDYGGDCVDVGRLLVQNTTEAYRRRLDGRHTLPLVRDEELSDAP